MRRSGTPSATIVAPIALLLAFGLLGPAAGLLPAVVDEARAETTAIGATARLAFDDPPLLAGGSKVGVLHLHHDHPEPVRVEITRVSHHERAADASSWIHLGVEGVVTIAPTDDWPLNVTVQVPQTAANGQYQAGVRFRVVPDEGDGPSGTGASVETAVTSAIVIRVDNAHQVARVDLRGSPSVFDAEAGGPLQFSVPLENTGNVDINPRVRLVVYDKFQERLLSTVWFNDTVLKPGESRVVVFMVPETQLSLDQYWAVVEVYVGAEKVHTAHAQTFDVVAAGSLARRAELRTILIEGDQAFVRAGALLKLTAVVRNTGQAPVVATFKGEVKRDGVLVDTVESDAIEVPIGGEQGLVFFYTGDAPGRYEILGRVFYGTKVTEEKSLIVTMSGASSAGVPWLWLALAAVAVVLVSAVVVIARRKRQGAGAKRPARRGARRPAAGRPQGRARRVASTRPPPGAGGRPGPRSRGERAASERGRR